MKTYNRREVERIILKNGWELDHCTGGHSIYKKEGVKKTLSIAYKKCNRMVVQRLIKEFVGESASGKSSIERELIALGFNKIVTYTTRPMRKEDVDGETYHFITEEQFNDMIEKDLFAEHASYNGWQYGTAKEDCTDDKVVVLTPHGLRQLKKNKDLHIISFYIDVPRRDRLIKILERGDDIEESYRRNLSDVGQFDGIKDEVDYVIPNKGYSWSPLNMAHIIKRSMEWMKC